MIPVKIECGCGQRYAFEVEPMNGHMPTAVKCPACGADGTAAANALIAQLAPPQSAASAPAPTRIRLSASAPSLEQAASPVTLAAAPPAPDRVSHRREIERARITTEARAKIFWGDAPEEVTKFLMCQGLDHTEASDLVAGMYKERLATLRGIGLRRVLIGGGMICVPVVAFFLYMRAGYLPIKLFAVKVAVGLWGAWMFIRGAFMLLAPRLGSEDIADEQDD
jgi:hypothetical protein